MTQSSLSKQFYYSSGKIKILGYGNESFQTISWNTLHEDMQIVMCHNFEQLH